MKIRTAAAVIAAAAALMATTGSAHAYDTRTCFDRLSVGLSDVDQFKMKTGSVDFGDGWHLGGSPLGDAVVCWGEDAGDITIVGKLYADSPTLINPAIDVRWFRTDGSYSTSPRHVFSGSNGESSAVSFQMPGAADVDRVRIRLWKHVLTNSGVDANLVNAQTFHRGDVNFQ